MIIETPGREPWTNLKCGHYYLNVYMCVCGVCARSLYAGLLSGVDFGFSV